MVIWPVPEGTTVVGVPGRTIPRRADRRARFDATLDHANRPDPVAELPRELCDRYERLRACVQALERFMGA
ncbi:MAG: hypothetical protein NZ898_09240 [Myxococcota bacterium]|nr:hypothetical protein [Myxococcota bacterium]MDW8361639.1 hypothetical protein [Myxococcales bacterium]